MTRIKAQTVEEKAQQECTKMFNTLGWALKMTQGSWCNNCKTFTHPQHTGSVDTLAIVRGQNGPVPVGVEVKATSSDRWEYNRWEPSQQRWASAWAEVIGSPVAAWMWLQMGTEDVDSKGSSPRTVWLIPQPLLTLAISRLTALGIGYLPMNAEAPQKLLASRAPSRMDADYLFTGYKLAYSSGLFWPLPDHPFWNLIGVTYVDRASAIDFTTNHPRPDQYATQGDRGTSSQPLRPSRRK